MTQRARQSPLGDLENPERTDHIAPRSIAAILQTYSLRILIGFFVIGAIAIVTYFQVSQRDIVDNAAIRRAHDYSRALEEFRTLYTSEVVETARAHGLEVTHDYEKREGAIPLPATLSMILGERIGAAEGGAGARLYSEYPFPWREKTGGLRDEFDKETWRRLNEDPRRPFYRFVTVDGRRVLRYARADLMRSSCVGCHNSHPLTPRDDWKVGDVRGILEVTVPMEAIATEADQLMVGGYILMGVLGFLGIGGLLLFVAAESRQRKSLEKKGRELTQTIDSLGDEAIERHQVEARLQIMFDAAPYGLLVVDRNGEIVQASAGTKSVLGYDLEELVGKSIDSFLPELFRSTHTEKQNSYHCPPETLSMRTGSELDAAPKGRLECSRRGQS